MKNIIKNLKLKRRGITLLARLHFFGNPSAKLKIVGVTGTSGKTTTVTLLYKVTRGLGYKAGLISTVEHLINDEVVKVEHTRPVPPSTPDPIYLYTLLNKMVREGCEYVFMEVTSQAADQNRVAGINFTGGVFTNFSQDHLDYHKDMEDYFRAKKKFFFSLPTAAFALANTDDNYGKRMLENIQAKKLSFGFNNGEDFHAEISDMSFSGLTLKFNQTPVKSKLLGSFNAYNLLTAWSVCSLLGFNMNKVNKLLEDVEPPKGRFEHFTSPTGVLVIVDYAHKPDALEKIFLALKETKLTNGKLISVFGCGGNKDPFKRPIMGRIGAVNSDIAIFTSDNPRDEDPAEIIEEMKANLSREELEKVMTIVNRRDAILKSVESAKNGDIILCMGKGHENYQEIKGVKHHFDDMEELKKAFQ